jgi:hypothetical protein
MPCNLVYAAQGSLQALMRLVSQDVTLCDGTGLELPGHPLTVSGPDSVIRTGLLTQCCSYGPGSLTQDVAELFVIVDLTLPSG